MTNKLFIRYGEKARSQDFARNSKKSLAWFRSLIRKDRASFDRVSENLKRAKLVPGEMITYQYDPKYKNELPFYDKFPLIIFLESTPDGWYGANIHYLPPAIRQKLFEEMNYKKTNLARIKRFLESNELTRTCLKRYLSSHLKSAPMRVPKTEWDIAIFLPFEGFQKASNKTVWSSRKGRR